MAVSITPTETLTTLWTGEVTTGWTGITVDTFSGINREGTYCLGIVVSNATVQGYYTVSSFSALTNKIYIWMVGRGQMDSLAAGGVRIVVGDGTNRMAYYVGGYDYVPAFNVNGWTCYMLDANNLPTGKATIAGSEGSMSWGAITQVGVGFKTTAKSLGGTENCFVDIARRGTGLNIKGGVSSDPGAWAEIAADDASTASGKAYGIVMEFQPGVYGVQGDVNWGDDSSTTDTYFEDTNATIVFMDTGAAAYNMTIVGNSTGTNSFVDGVIVGSGDTARGRAGSTYLSAGPSVTMDFSDSNVDELSLYGTKFSLIDQGITFGADTTHECLGVTFQACGQIDVGAVIVRNCTWSETTSTLGSLLWSSSINIKNSAFIAHTTGAGIQHTSATGSPFTYDNLTFSGCTYDVNNTSGSTITISISNTPTGYPTTYTGTLVNFSTAVTLTLSGMVDSSEITIMQRGAAVDTGSDGSTTTGSRSFVTTNSWVTGAYKGHLLYITSGADTGRYYVSGNNATTLYLDAEMTATAGTLDWELYDENDDVELHHVENSSGDEAYPYTSGAGSDVDIMVDHTSYQYYVLEDYTLPSTNATLPIAQILDVNYYNP
jgi:hypothetical protein